MHSRRSWFKTMAGIGLSLAGFPAEAPAADALLAGRRPIIDITDLYHPFQDPGDNFDLITAYALPEVDLRAVILDATESFRGPVARDGHGRILDGNGPRDPGVIPVTQLNYIFNRNVPFAVGPFTPLSSPDDAKRDVPEFQQAGIELILDTLRASPETVDILSFGSARTLAAAWNRDPALLRRKVRQIHLSAGTSTPTYQEWNVALDPCAIVALIRSGLPIALYPCATVAGPFGYDRHNTYWRLDDLQFIRAMDAPLQRYLAYVFTRSSRVDFLRAMDSDWPEDQMLQVCRRRHNVWETAIWAEVAGLKLVRRQDGSARLLRATEIRPTDRILPQQLKPCNASTGPDGNYRFTLTGEPTNFRIYERGDPSENETALREALPALYQSYRTGRRRD